MEHQVPQFIEVEDKIVGPLTLKQFIYLAGGAGLCVVLYFELPFIAALLFGIPVGGLALALAFYKVNGKPFIETLEAAFFYYTGAKLFLWHKELSEAKKLAARKESEDEALAEHALIARKAAPRLTSGKLKELAWSLDVKNEQP